MTGATGRLGSLAAEARARLEAAADAPAMNPLVAAARSERVPAWRPGYRGFVASAAEMFAESRSTHPARAARGSGRDGRGP